MTRFGNNWPGCRTASSCAALVLGLSILCSASGCLPVFGQSAGSAIDRAESEATESGTSVDSIEGLETDGIDNPVVLLDGIDQVSQTPDELLKTIHESLAQTRGQRRPKEILPRQSWQATQEHHIAVGVMACKQLTDHAAATDEQLRESWKSKAVLLYRAAEHGWPKFTDRLSLTVDELKQTAFVEEAEYADGLLLVHRCFERQMPVHEVVENLTRHARDFPGGDTCAKLFLAYTRKLEERGMKNYAKQCCQAAIWALHDHPDVDSIRHQVSVLDAKTKLSKNWAAVSGSVQLKPDDAIQRELDQQVAQIRGMLPIRVDSATTLTDVSTGTHSINYRYTVTISAQQMDSQKHVIEQKVTQLARSVGATRAILAKGVSLNYSYHAPNGNRLLYFSVTK